MKDPFDISSAYLDGKDEGYDMGRADALKEELRFLRGKKMHQLIMDADCECCLAIPDWYQRRIRKLKLAVKVLEKEKLK